MINLERARGPYTVDRAGYIWGKSEKGGQTLVAQIRGWGYLTGKGHGALGLSDEEGIRIQTAWGNAIVNALNGSPQTQSQENK